ncbi:MAG: hypothetical protein FWE14_00040 [Lachnospiraceae bacterium]|nr:hypothetical protein [Lachnospiraceae bacterium]
MNNEILIQIITCYGIVATAVIIELATRIKGLKCDVEGLSHNIAVMEEAQELKVKYTEAPGCADCNSCYVCEYFDLKSHECTLYGTNKTSLAPKSQKLKVSALNAPKHPVPTAPAVPIVTPVMNAIALNYLGNCQV